MLPIEKMDLKVYKNSRSNDFIPVCYNFCEDFLQNQAALLKAKNKMNSRKLHEVK